MSRIWGYGNANTKTATGKKWQGNVIAVPAGYELGKVYTITYVENGVTKTIEALAVDRTKDSFSAPKGSELFNAIRGRDVKIELGSKPQEKAVEPELPAASPAPAPAPAPSVAEEVKPAFTTEQGVELAKLFNEKGMRTSAGSEFACAGCIVDEPKQSREMAKTILQNVKDPEAKISQLTAIFEKDEAAKSSISQEYNLYKLSRTAPQVLPPAPAPAPVPAPAPKVQEKPVQPAAVPQAAVDDKQLAAFLVKHTSVKDMTCQSCIKRNRAHVDEFISAIEQHGTEAHMAELRNVLGLSKEKTPKVSNNASLSSDVQSCSLEDMYDAGKASEPFNYNLLGGAYYVGQSTGSDGVFPFAQGGVKYNFTADTAFNLGASLRPESEASGLIKDSRFNPLEFNISHDHGDGLTMKYGLSTWIGNHNSQKDPFTSTSILSCGCTGTGDISTVALRDQIFSGALNEYSIAGIHAEKKYDETFIRGSVGVPVNSMIFDSSPAVLAAIRHNFTDKLAGSFSVAGQSGQLSANTGASYNLTDTTKLSGNIFHHEGRVNKTGVEARVEQQLGEKLAAAVTALGERNHDLGQDSWNIRPALEYKINENAGIGVFGIFGKQGKDDEKGAGVGFSWSF